MNKDQANKVISQHESLVIATTYNILFTNDIVCGFVVEAIGKIQKSPLYKHRTKQLINQCSIERRKYETFINRIIGDKDDFFANANDSFRVDIDKYLNTLYYSIKQAFDNNCIKHSDVISSLEVARTMCEFSCAQFDKRIKELKDTDSRFDGFAIEYMRLTSLLHKLHEVMRSLDIPVTVNLNTPNCAAAINILSKKLIDGEIISKAISA